MTSIQFYAALLYFYPVRFRTRFAAEMLQVFGDTYRIAIEKGGLDHLLSFWLRTAKDLFSSIPSQWRQEIVASDCQMDVTGMGDLFITSIVVVTNLLVWGGFATNVVLRRNTELDASSIILTIGFAFLIGLLTYLVTRNRKTNFPRINL